MHRVARVRIRQHRDQPLDLAPATEHEDVAALATVRGAVRGFIGRLVAIVRNQRIGLDDGLTIGHKRKLHNGPFAGIGESISAD